MWATCACSKRVPCFAKRSKLGVALSGLPYAPKALELLVVRVARGGGEGWVGWRRDAVQSLCVCMCSVYRIRFIHSQVDAQRVGKDKDKVWRLLLRPGRPAGAVRLRIEAAVLAEEVAAQRRVCRAGKGRTVGGPWAAMQARPAASARRSLKLSSPNARRADRGLCNVWR